MKKNIICTCLIVMVIVMCMNILTAFADSRNSRYFYSTPTPRPKYGTVTWKCVDATSYDGNAYNDNKCTSSTGQVRYVADSEARKLDPSYRPGKSGAWYYNNK